MCSAVFKIGFSKLFFLSFGHGLFSIFIKHNFGETAGSSGIVAEMLKPSGPGGASMIRDLIENIISVNRIPTELQVT